MLLPDVFIYHSNQIYLMDQSHSFCEYFLNITVIPGYRMEGKLKKISGEPIEHANIALKFHRHHASSQA